MREKLREIQLEAGGIFAGNVGVPSSFGNDSAALRAAREGVAICDRSHWGLLRLTGEDRLRFLHNQTTNQIDKLQPGQSCDTVFVSSTGRTIDLATVWVKTDELLVLVSPDCRQRLWEWMDRFIFPMDRVELGDVSNEYAIFTSIGPKSDILLQNIEHLFSESSASSPIKGGDSGLALPGFTLIVPIDRSAEIWQAIVESGAVPMGDRCWERLRILQGRPAAGAELTEDYNPLEAGLLEAISFEKGCYIGQETIARLNTYKGVKQRLWGVRLDAFVPPDTPVMVEGSKEGILTSCIETEEGAFGLAYVRTKAGGAGLQVKIGDSTAELVSVPFLTHGYYQGQQK